MPTPVGVARQCLTPEAAHALDEAVAVARRRGHAQTTSLHAVSALLSLSSSILRDACARARNSAYSPRLQFKALELCLSVSLDRVPSTQLTDDPPVSNSLMAAIKRSQANQRRQPENFHLYHQISQQPASVSCVKVELQHLILSILDDPVVSRVFGEAGFRSSEIKLAIIRPLPQLLRYSRSRGPPIFLCNLTEHPDPGRRSFSFPFSGSSSCDENYRRIGEVLSRSRGRNPLLLGTCAYDALRSFTEAVDKRKDGVLPVELSGLHVICIGKDVSKFITENCNNETMSTRFKEITQMVEHCVGPGLLVNFGDLKPFVSENGSSETVSFIVAQLTKLLELNYGKFWLMGAAASYECYLKFVGRFSSIEKEWDLQLLPITSVRSSMAESYPSQRPRSSLMDSFVPFGGFFSSPSDLKCPLNGSYYCVPHCHQCGDRCEQEVRDVSKERFSASAVDPYQSNLLPWLQNSEHGMTKGLNIKTKDDGVLLDTHESGPHKRWDKMIQQPCQNQLILGANTSPSPTIVGFQSSNQKKEDVDNHSSKTTVAPPSQDIDLNSGVPVGAQMFSTSQSSSPFTMVSKAKPEKYTSKLTEMLQKVDDLEPGDVRSSNMSNSSVCDGSQMSPASVTSVTTDLGLGICPSPTSSKSKLPTGQHAMEPPKEIPTRLSFGLDCGNIHKNPAQSSSCLSSDYCGQVDPRNLKKLFEALAKKVSWQDEALRVIIKTIANCQAKMGRRNRANQRGDIWMNFVGPDRHGKKKIAVSLAEFMYGSQESFIFLDLCSEEMKGYDVKYRGKTTLDFIVGKLCKKPLAVVFLENVDKADMLAQNSLSQAIKSGKITDSHGREVGLNNAIFVTSFSVPQNSSMPTREHSEYSEENILRTKGGTIKIKVEYVVESVSCQSFAVFGSSKEGNPNLMFVHKRKLDDNEVHKQHKISDTGKRAHKTSNRLLDLNLPAEVNELQHMDDGNSNDVSVTEKQHPWLQDLYDQVDETVVFEPFNFDALADRVLKVIRRSFHKILGPECVLQIESEVMEQLLAAAYVSDKDTEVEDWVEQVLSSGFTEVQRKYNLSAHSIVKLASCQGQALGVYLPPTITID